VSVYHGLIENLKQHNPNIYLVEGEYIWDVLNISDIVVQRCSTVAIESWLLYKPTIELELMPSTDHFLQPIYKSGSHIVTNSSEMIATVKGALIGNYKIDSNITKNRLEILKIVITNRYAGATKIISAYIDSLLQQSSSREIIKHLDNKNKIKYLLRRLFGMKGYVFISNLWKLKFGDYLGRYDKSFTKEDRLNWERKLSDYLEH
jgi:hypothetical protein